MSLVILARKNPQRSDTSLYLRREQKVEHKSVAYAQKCY